MSVYAKLVKAYKVSCPIVALTTSDPAKSLAAIGEAFNAEAGPCQEVGIINWDVVRGFTVPDQPAAQKANALKAIGTVGDAEQAYLPQALASLVKNGGGLQRATVVVIQNAQRFITETEVIQAVWNVRDAFKNPRRMLVLMGPSIKIPVELQNDVIELDEPLPTHEELTSILGGLVKSIGINADKTTVSDAAAASQGLSAFGAEQLTALNLSKADGLNVRGVWDDKCRKIGETPGLRVVSGGSFGDVAGVENIKGFLKAVMTGKNKPNAIVFVDEIEKSIGGSTGMDTSGVSQDQLGVLLQWMQDRRATGCILVGPPGAAKSALAKTAGGEAGVPTIQLDLGGMKGSLVGESETRIRDALKVVDSVSGGKTLWLATCNSLTSLPPELRRRFKYGTWFFDLPDATERAAIWSLYCKKYGHKVDKKLIELAWTGAEIESCCEIAHNTGMSLADASGYIVPVSVAAADKIEALRAGADGKFLSASQKGIYSRAAIAQSQGGRIID